MTGLLRSELRRITSRRVGRILAIILLALIVLVLGRIAQVSRPPDTNRDRASAQLYAEVVRQCEEERATGNAPPGASCEEFAADVTASRETRLQARSALRAGVITVAVILIVMALVLGASYVGAEWSHGTMQALLFWEPRRTRVLVAKMAALVIVCAAFTLAVQALVYGGVYAIAATRGTTEGVTGGLHMSNLLTVLRSVLVVSMMALLAFGISGLSRYTAAALGAAGGYFIIVENFLIRPFRPGWQPYFISDNIAAILNKRVPLMMAEQTGFDGSGVVLKQAYLSGVRGTVTLGIYLAVVLAAFYLSFTRRDVT